MLFRCFKRACSCFAHQHGGEASSALSCSLSRTGLASAEGLSLRLQPQLNLRTSSACNRDKLCHQTARPFHLFLSGKLVHSTVQYVSYRSMPVLLRRDPSSSTPRRGFPPWSTPVTLGEGCSVMSDVVRKPYQLVASQPPQRHPRYPTRQRQSTYIPTISNTK